MEPETWPAMFIITSSPAPDSESSVTSLRRLSCQRPTTFGFVAHLRSRRLQRVNGARAIVRLAFPGGKNIHFGLHSPNRRICHAARASRAIITVSFKRDHAPSACFVLRLAHCEGLLAVRPSSGTTGTGFSTTSHKKRFLCRGLRVGCSSCSTAKPPLVWPTSLFTRDKLRPS
jgi:hypothetical protein